MKNKVLFILFIILQSCVPNKTQKQTEAITLATDNQYLIDDLITKWENNKTISHWSLVIGHSRGKLRIGSYKR